MLSYSRLFLRRFVFCMFSHRGERETRVTGDEAQGTIERETSGWVRYSTQNDAVHFLVVIDRNDNLLELIFHILVLESLIG